MHNDSGQTWQGFQSGDKPDLSLTAGTWLGYLLPGIREIPTQYGGALKLRYNVFVPGRNGTRRFEQSELASPTFTTGSKFIKRLAAVNPGIPVTEETDLSTLKTEGYCLVELVPKPGTNYLQIGNVTQVPRGYNIPVDIGDPAAPALDMRTQDGGSEFDFSQLRDDELPAVVEPPF
jgi:hypothetical protein